MNALNRVHCQRIAAAAREAQLGREVELYVNLRGPINGVLCWRCGSRESVIAAGHQSHMEVLLPLAQAEFERLVKGLEEESAVAAGA